MKQDVLIRIPPGDRWAEIPDGKAKSVNEYSEKDIIGETLTDSLAFIYNKYQIRKFDIDAGRGVVSIDDGIPSPSTTRAKWYNLYED